MNAATCRRVMPLFANTVACLHPGCGHVVSAPTASARVDAFLAHLNTHVLPGSGPDGIAQPSSGLVPGEMARTSSPADSRRTGAGPNFARSSR